MNKLLACIIFTVLWSAVLSQQILLDSTVHLNEIEIKGEKSIDFTTGSTVQTLSGLNLKSRNIDGISSILSTETLVVLKKYGASGNTSTSIRGSGTNHTAVVWNGFNIQSPMNGGVNLTLVPLASVDEISVQYGGASVLNGSGAIGGALYLNNTVRLNDGFCTEAYFSIGSFGSKSTVLNSAFSGKKAALKTSVQWSKADNNFPISDIKTQKNSATQSFGIQNTALFQITKLSDITTNVWFGSSNHEVPLLESDELVGSQGPYQIDNVLNSAIQWRMKQKKYLVYFKSGYFLNYLHYIDSLKDTDSEMITTSWISELSNSYKFSNFYTANITVTQTNQLALTSNYEQMPTRSSTAFLSANKFYLGKSKLKALLNIHTEYVDKEFVPIIYSLGIEKNMLTQFKIKSSVSKNFRLPTFNELYWKEWGNLGLKPEKGHSADISLQYTKTFEKFSFNVQTGMYGSLIQNWILWTPSSENTAIWHPNNIAEVRTFGSENRIQFAYCAKDISVQTTVLYTYSVSQNNKKESENYLNQLPYEPYHSGHLNVKLFWKKAYASVQNSFTSKRFTDDTNMESLALDSYFLTNLSVSYEFKKDKYSLIPSFSTLNIFNTKYNIMYSYAMPGRSFNLSISVKFNNK